MASEVYEVPESIENDWATLYRHYPEVYDRFASFGYKPTAYQVLSKVFAFADKTVVDVGGGTGRSTLAFAEMAEQVIHVEPESAMISHAMGLAMGRRVNNVEFVTGTSQHTTLMDSSVDIVAAITAPLDPTEAMRILRPGGVAIYLDTAPGWYGGELCRVIEHDTSEYEAEMAARMEGFGYFDYDSTQYYGTAKDLIDTYGFIFGKKVIERLRQTPQTTIKWRCRVYYKVKDALFDKSEPRPIFVTLKTPRDFYADIYVRDIMTTVAAGEYEVERIVTPEGQRYHGPGCSLILKGTKTGIPEHLLRQYGPGTRTKEEDIVLIEE